VVNVRHLHDLEESGLNAGHVRGPADRDTWAVGPVRPGTANHDGVASEGVADGCAGAFGVDHEVVGLRGGKGIAHLGQSSGKWDLA
jgi:hypothetical protein